MKIGILTFHDGINHGAFLQTYALYKTLEGLGYSTHVINYKNFTHYKNEYGGLLSTRYPSKFIKQGFKIARFWAFQRQHLNLTRFMFRSEKINNYDFDAVIVGSDEVWNFNNPAFGLDPVYFGIGLKARKLISYAASFGAQYDENNIPDLIKEGINRFDAISVRDANSLKMASASTSKKITLVVDPTFLYDFSKEENTYSSKHSDYIALYSPLLDKEDIVSIIKYAQITGLPVISIGYYHAWCDANIPYLNPFVWMSYIKNAHMVITSTFHGTIYSLRYSKEFCTIIKPYWRYKIESILKDLGVFDRVVTAKNGMEKIFSEKIDYERVHSILGTKTMYSIQFLKDSLND